MLPVASAASNFSSNSIRPRLALCSVSSIHDNNKYKLLRVPVPNTQTLMYDDEEQEDRLRAYESGAPPVSMPSSARTRLQGLGSGIVQRRYRMATESVLCEEPSGPAGIGLQSLSHSRMGTSPLINLVRPSASGLLMSTSGILSKSASFQSVPTEGLSTRFIDDVKIKQHQERTSQHECQLRAQARRQAAYKAAASFAKSKLDHLFMYF